MPRGRTSAATTTVKFLVDTILKGQLSLQEPSITDVTTSGNPRCGAGRERWRRASGKSR